MTAALLLAEHPALARRLVVVGAPAMGVGPGRQFELKGWRHLKTPGEQSDIHRHNLGVLMLHDARLIDEETLALHALNVARDRLPRRRLSQTAILAEVLARVHHVTRAAGGQCAAREFCDLLLVASGRYAALLEHSLS